MATFQEEVDVRMDHCLILSMSPATHNEIRVGYGCGEALHSPGLDLGKLPVPCLNKAG